MKFIGRTHQGRIRENNEDALAYDVEFGVAVLADGMGGLQAGELASQAAVDAVLEILQVRTIDPALVTKCVDLANSRVRELADGRKSLGNMGTTLVLWAVSGSDRCIIGHVGDSRAYRYRDRHLFRLTSDHSVVQGMVDEGLMTPEEAQVASNRNVITRAVGLAATVVSEVVELAFQPGDRFLLCSDGLTDLLTDSEIVAILNEADSATVPDLLISAANEAGGTDNISVLFIAPDE